MTDLTRNNVADAAEATAVALRRVAIQPQVADTDRPLLLMNALGWDEFARQIRGPDTFTQRGGV